MIKNINKLLLTTALAVGSLSLAVAGGVGSTSSTGNFYGKVEAGGAISTKLSSQSFKFAKSKTDTDPAFGVEAGYKLDNNLRVGLNLGYQQNDVSSLYTQAKGTGEDAIPRLNFKMGKLKLGVAMFNVYYDIENGSKFTPYFTVGFGASRNKVDKSSVKYNVKKEGKTVGGFNLGDMSTKDNSSVDYKSNTKNNFAWNIGLGGLYKINQSISLDVGYKFKDLGKISTSTEDTDGVEFFKLSKEYTAKLRTHNIMFGVIYSF